MSGTDKSSNSISDFRNDSTASACAITQKGEDPIILAEHPNAGFPIQLVKDLEAGEYPYRLETYRDDYKHLYQTVLLTAKAAEALRKGLNDDNRHKL